MSMIGCLPRAFSLASTNASYSTYWIMPAPGGGARGALPADRKVDAAPRGGPRRARAPRSLRRRAAPSPFASTLPTSLRRPSSWMPRSDETRLIM